MFFDIFFKEKSDLSFHLSYWEIFNSWRASIRCNNFNSIGVSCLQFKTVDEAIEHYTQIINAHSLTPELDLEIVSRIKALSNLPIKNNFSVYRFSKFNVYTASLVRDGNIEWKDKDLQRLINKIKDLLLPTSK